MKKKIVVNYNNIIRTIRELEERTPEQKQKESMAL